MLGDYTKSADDQVSRDKRHWFLTFCFKYLHLEIVVPNILMSFLEENTSTTFSFQQLLKRCLSNYIDFENYSQRVKSYEFEVRLM